jgi:hypothetical protein
MRMAVGRVEVRNPLDFSSMLALLLLSFFSMSPGPLVEVSYFESAVK